MTTDRTLAHTDATHDNGPRKRKRIIISDDESDDSSTEPIIDLTHVPTRAQTCINTGGPPKHHGSKHSRTARFTTTTLSKNLSLITHRHITTDTDFTHPDPSSVKPLLSTIFSAHCHLQHHLILCRL